MKHLLYAVGGSTSPPDDLALATVEVYDPATGSWTTKRDLNTPRGAPAVAAVNGKIYAIGGQKESRGRDRLGGGVRSCRQWRPRTTKTSVMLHPRIEFGCGRRGR